MSDLENAALSCFHDTVRPVRKSGNLIFHLNSSGEVDPLFDHTSQVVRAAHHLGEKYLPDSFSFHGQSISKPRALQLLRLAAIMHDINYGLSPRSTEIDSARFMRQWMRGRNFTSLEINVASQAILNTSLSQDLLCPRKRISLITGNPLAVLLAAADIISVISPRSNYTQNPFFQNGQFYLECRRLGNVPHLTENLATWTASQSRFFHTQLSQYCDWFSFNPVLAFQSGRFRQEIDRLLPSTLLNPASLPHWQSYLSSLPEKQN